MTTGSDVVVSDSVQTSFILENRCDTVQTVSVSTKLSASKNFATASATALAGAFVSGLGLLFALTN